MKLSILLLLTTAFAHAGVILNAPDPKAGFFEGMSDYFGFDGTGQLAGVSSSPLPAANGLTTHKLFGSAFMPDGNYDPYIVMAAWGTASGSFDVDTQMSVQFQFTVNTNAQNGLAYYLNASLMTDDGFYNLEFNGNTADGTQGVTYALYNNFADIIAAGVEVKGWELSLGVGSFGGSTYLSDLTVTIPANSIEFIATPNGQPIQPVPPPVTSDVPEPSTFLFAAAGFALLIGGRLRHAGGSETRALPTRSNRLR